MNWILASLCMFVSSIILYLFLRKSTLLGTPLELNNLATFFIPSVFYFAMASFTHTSLHLDTVQLAVILFAAIFCSYLGNIFSFKSIEYAPNPGYSLIISKSYVVFTALVSVFLFHASLTGVALFSIFLIVIASSFVMIDKAANKKSHVRSSWLPLSVGAFFCWGVLSLTFKYLNTIGVNSIERLFYITLIATVIIAVEILLKKKKFSSISAQQISILLALGILSAGFNYFMQEGLNSAPNIGYVNAINASSISVLSIFSALIFKDELNIRKLLGVFGVTGGLILLVIQK